MLNENFTNERLNEFLTKNSFNLNWLDRKQYAQLSEQFDILSTFNGITEKFKEITSISKVPSGLSELDFAHEFSLKGFSIELIHDGHKRFVNKKSRIRSPDFIAKKDNEEYFVEVTKITKFDPNECLKKYLDNDIKNYPIWIWIHFSEEYSIPQMDSKERSAFEEKAKSLAKKIKEQLPEYRNLGSHVSIDGCTIHLNWLPKNQKGFIGGPVIGYSSPDEKISSYIEKRLLDKSREFLSWSSQNNPDYYLLALDLEDFYFFPYGIRHLLYGGTTHYSKKDFGDRKPMCFYELVHFLESKDFAELDEKYKELLFKVGFDPDKESIINYHGIFLSRRDELENVAGVLVKSHGSHQYLPNPFALRGSSKLIDYFDYPILPKFY